MTGNLRTLALFGLSGKDEAVIASLLELVSDRMTDRWVIDNTADNPDRIVINTSDVGGGSIWQTFEERGAQRIALVEGEAPGDAQNILTRPIRSQQLIAVLEQPLFAVPRRQDIGGGDPVMTGRYRLKRWPDMKVIQSQPDSMRLSAIMMRHAMTITEVSNITQVAPEKVQQFVKTCQENGWLRVDSAGKYAPEISTEYESKNGIFNRIRARLGL